MATRPRTQARGASDVAAARSKLIKRMRKNADIPRNVFDRTKPVDFDQKWMLQVTGIQGFDLALRHIEYWLDRRVIRDMRRKGGIHRKAI